jgi:hypothetical protein
MGFMTGLRISLITIAALVIITALASLALRPAHRE